LLSTTKEIIYSGRYLSQRRQYSLLSNRHKTTLQALLIPGGVLLLVAVVLLSTGWLTLALPGIVFAYYASLVAGLVLAWRFHFSRVFFALLVIFLAQHGLAHFSAGHPPLAGAPRTARDAIAFFLPLNFIGLSLMRERGFTSSAVGTTSLVLFVQSVIVFVTGNIESSHPAAGAALASAPLPTYLWAVFAVVAIGLLARFFLFRKPVEIALFWSQAAFFLALDFGGVAREATAYFAVSALILAASVVETSYALAYHDELTALPSRRAFNDALLRLQAPYSLAMVDIDHFKRFNDTYGHDTGDEVLRLVASRLAHVTGGGQGFRCGGEEFVILFPGKSTQDVIDHLEKLRATIAASCFHMRGDERRQTPRGPDRRTQRSKGRAMAGRAIRQFTKPAISATLSVTVSIGVASAEEQGSNPERVIQAADQALYRAKDAGRNRVETATSPRRARRRSAGIA
jgi:diguanylate cyclase (GGDEF)-like protein